MRVGHIRIHDEREHASRIIIPAIARN
jgi:hypothetical protein